METLNFIIFLLLKMILSILQKKSAFCRKTSYFREKIRTPRRQLRQCSRLAHNRLQSFSISLFGQKLTDVTIWSTILSAILITIIVAERWFLYHVHMYNYRRCSVCVHSTTEVKGL